MSCQKLFANLLFLVGVFVRHSATPVKFTAACGLGRRRCGVHGLCIFILLIPFSTTGGTVASATTLYYNSNKATLGVFGFYQERIAINVTSSEWHSYRAAQSPPDPPNSIGLDFEGPRVGRPHDAPSRSEKVPRRYDSLPTTQCRT
jgi:hypothetical protein